MGNFSICLQMGEKKEHLTEKNSIELKGLSRNNWGLITKFKKNWQISAGGELRSLD